jgi:protoheme IX farnesyltransferase
MSTQTTSTNAPSSAGFVGKVKAYIALTKPRVVELLLITTVPTMVLAHASMGAGGLPNLWLVLGTLIGGALSAGSANSFNCYIDIDIDKIMGRTKSRPLVTGELTARQALAFSWIIGIISVLWLGLLVNWLAAAISLAAILFYVFVYTLVLKRRTPQNIVWGGAAGATPVLIGWAAVTGDLSLTPWILFMMIFLWTPPHYWPLSVKYRDDYARAGVPMLPVVRSARTVVVHVVLYAWAFAVCTLLLIPIADMGWIYAVAAIAGAAWFIPATYRMYREGLTGEITQPMRVFHMSNIYLTLLFVAIAVDPFIRF